MSTSERPPRRRTWKGPRERPAALPDAACYVLWRYGSTPNGKGKYPKIPFSPHKGADGKYHKAAMDDSTTWGDWAACIAAATAWPSWFDGIGKVLMPGEVGIDLDDGVDPAHAAALHSAAQGRAYRETSVSGKGSHIIALGRLADAIKTDTIEIYPGGSGRYFALGDELDGSAAPGTAQDVIDQAVRLSGAQPRTSLRLVETVALTAELTGEIREAEARLPDLLRELPGNLTPQLADLIYRNVFPPAMKDRSASGARAVVVAQLHRAPKRRYSDAEIYVLARDIWQRKEWEGAMHGDAKALDKDAWRLIASYRPGAPPKPTKRRYSDAPDPLVYLAQLADEAAGGVVLLNRDERAALVGCPRPTAQRIEQHLVKQGLITLDTIALRGPGTKGRRGILHITAAGQQAITRNESVIFSEPATNDQVTPSAPESDKPSIAPPKNTLVCDRAPRAARAHNPRVLPAPAPIAEEGGASYDPGRDWTAGGVLDLRPFGSTAPPFVEAEQGAWWGMQPAGPPEPRPPEPERVRSWRRGGPRVRQHRLVRRTGPPVEVAPYRPPLPLPLADLPEIRSTMPEPPPPTYDVAATIGRLRQLATQLATNPHADHAAQISAGSSS